LGTLVNVATIVAGTLAGVVIGPRLAERIRSTVLAVLGLVTVASGIEQALRTRNVVFPLIGLALGGALGEALRLEERVESFGDALGRRLRHRGGHVGEAFVTATLVYCVGPLAVLGSIQDGLGRGTELLMLKSGLDGFASIVFASTLGWGVGLAAVPVAIYQGAVTALAGVIDPLLTPRMVIELTAAGGVMVMAIGLRLLEIQRIRVASLLPALVITPVLVGLFAR
jgi:uncharacterized membrane protein YqgA involved in biofilm formation